MARNNIRTVVAILTDGRRLTFRGRDAWALTELVRAGETGCTPITHPGPRWSHYVFKIRGAGLVVETVTEKHAGEFAGTHARYILRTPVTLVDVDEGAS